MNITEADRALAAGFAGQLEPTFKVAGETFTRADMLAANVDDAATCAWLATAKAGDVLEQMHAERVECVPATQRKRQFPFPWALTQPHGIYVALGCSRSPVWGRPVASMGYAAIAPHHGGA